MNLFKDKVPSPSAKIQQIRGWVRHYLSVSEAVPISISQLQCHDPCCPPIETVISIMAQPVQSYKIHCSIDQLEEAQIQALTPSLPNP